MEKGIARKKGFIFTLDAVIAIIIVVTILLISNYYINKSKGPSLSKIQLVKRGSDDLLSIYNQGAFRAEPAIIDGVLRLNQTIIFNQLTKTRIPTYNIELVFNGTGVKNYPNFTVGDPRLSQVETGSGRMIFVLSDGKKISGFYTVRYFIWTR